MEQLYGPFDITEVCTLSADEKMTRIKDNSEVRTKVGRGAENMSAPERNVELEAAVFRRLLAHLDSRKDVQNIELMNLAGFCRNCLSKWYVAAAEEAGETVDLETARELVYGMPYADWKARYQTEASPEQKAAFEADEKRSG